MRRVVIVEDNIEEVNKLSSFIQKFFDKVEEPVDIKIYNSSLIALEEYVVRDDTIIFLDIDLPFMNGMEFAKKIREKDENAIIIFCSNLPQFALKGYEVAALDYIVKPYDYSNIEHRLIRATNIRNNAPRQKIVLKIGASENRVIDCNSITYIEKDRNYLIFHTLKEDIRVRGSLQMFEKLLPLNLFSYCTKGVYVNLSHVEKTTSDSIIVRGKTLPLSRQRKKTFIENLFAFFDNKFGD